MPGFGPETATELGLAEGFPSGLVFPAKTVGCRARSVISTAQKTKIRDSKFKASLGNHLKTQEMWVQRAVAEQLPTVYKALISLIPRKGWGLKKKARRLGRSWGG